MVFTLKVNLTCRGMILGWVREDFGSIATVLFCFDVFGMKLDLCRDMYISRSCTKVCFVEVEECF